MLLYRLGPEGFYAAASEGEPLRMVYSDPFAVAPEAWELGRVVESGPLGAMAPVHPGKIIGIGRNYRGIEFEKIIKNMLDTVYLGVEEPSEAYLAEMDAALDELLEQPIS